MVRGGQWPDRHSSPRSLVNAGEILNSEITTQLLYIKSCSMGVTRHKFAHRGYPLFGSWRKRVTGTLLTRILGAKIHMLPNIETYSIWGSPAVSCHLLHTLLLGILSRRNGKHDCRP